MSSTDLLRRFLGSARADEIFAARDVSKMHSTSPDAFAAHLRDESTGVQVASGLFLPAALAFVVAMVYTSLQALRATHAAASSEAVTDAERARLEAEQERRRAEALGQALDEHDR